MTERKPIRKFDAHRLMGLIFRYPKHKWRFKLWQFMWIEQHVKQCYECGMRADEMNRRNPQIGPTPGVN